MEVLKNGNCKQRIEILLQWIIKFALFSLIIILIWMAVSLYDGFTNGINVVSKLSAGEADAEINALGVIFEISLFLLISSLTAGLILTWVSNGFKQMMKKLGKILLEQSIQGIVVGIVAVVLTLLLTQAVSNSFEIVEVSKTKEALESEMLILQEKIDQYE